MKVLNGLTVVFTCIIIFSIIDSYSTKKKDKNVENEPKKKQNKRFIIKSVQKQKKKHKKIIYKNEICLKPHEVPPRSGFSKLRFFNEINSSDQFVIPYEFN